MKDGHTTRLPRGETLGRVFLASHRAALFVVEGPSAGAEYEILEGGVTVGRGPGVDIALPDRAMSKVHAAFEPVTRAFVCATWEARTASPSTAAASTRPI